MSDSKERIEYSSWARSPLVQEGVGLDRTGQFYMKYVPPVLND